jgi:hypothetical protein
VLLFVVATGFGVWLTSMRHSHTATTTTTAQGQEAMPISEGGLATLASLGRAIYWAGPRSGDTYELTQRPGGRVYLRYLPAGEPIGSPKMFLTIASYPLANAFAITTQLAAEQDSVKVQVGQGGVAFYRTRLPTNIYVAYPGSDYQIEVFDPSATEAQRLVLTGAIRQVRGRSGGVTVPKTAAVAVSPAQLEKLAARLGRPLYWAGPSVATTYELTQIPDGRVYVRYLPTGVKVGSQQPYLTIGTYPVANAYTTTRSAAKQPGSVVIPIRGGIAFYNAARPTSVYLAFQGISEQIEVFDPSAAELHSVVARQFIRAVS